MQNEAVGATKYERGGSKWTPHNRLLQRYGFMMAEVPFVSLIHFWVGVAIGVAADRLSRAMSPPVAVVVVVVDGSQSSGKAAEEGPDAKRKAQLAGEITLTVCVIVVLFVVLKLVLDRIYQRILAPLRRKHIGEHLFFPDDCDGKTGKSKQPGKSFGNRPDVDSVPLVGALAMVCGRAYRCVSCVTHTKRQTQPCKKTFFR